MASELDISNGHAARMRFSRFKSQMEGSLQAPKRARPSALETKKPKEKESKKQVGQELDLDQEYDKKLEKMDYEKTPDDPKGHQGSFSNTSAVKLEPLITPEPLEEPCFLGSFSVDRQGEHPSPLPIVVKCEGDIKMEAMHCD